MHIAAHDTDRKRAITTYYDGMTPYYRFFYSGIGLHYGLWERHTFTLRRALLNHKQAMFARLGHIDADSHILDAGCGIGWTSVFFSRLGACRVTGITLSSVQIQQAQQHAGNSGVADRVSFLRQDFSATDFADNTFTHVFASESSCHAENKAAWLTEMRRVLKPGGRLVIADCYLLRREQDMDKRQHRHYTVFCRGFAVPHLPFWPDMERWITAAGFHVIETTDITAAVMPTARYIRLLGLLALPFGLLLRGLRLVPPELPPHLLACIEQPVALRKLGSYRLLTLEKPATSVQSS